MKNRVNKKSYYVFGSLAILFGLFMYWATSDIPLPKNAQKVGDMVYIDISEETTNEAEKREAFFNVPTTFTPIVSEGLFTFNFKFPDATPYTGNETPVPRDRVRVAVRHHAKIEAARSNYILLRTQPKDGPLKQIPYLVDSRDGLETYKFDYGRAGETNIGTYSKIITKDGSTLLVEDAGNWAKTYRVDRKLSSHIELTYLLQKSLVRDSKYFVEDVIAVDNALLKLVHSFQSK